MRINVISLILLLALVAPAAAQNSDTGCPHPTAQKAPPSAALVAARRAERQACAADMTRFCANVPPGCGRPRACLRSHMAELSTTCTNAMARMRAARTQAP